LVANIVNRRCYMSWCDWRIRNPKWRTDLGEHRSGWW